jgi:NAD(P)-dependent dehydrogenase (short-subunit alcohol dehydrogenase family)
MQEYGAIDVLILNAVVNPTMGPLLDSPPEAISKILEINVKAALMLISEAHPMLAPHVRSLSFPACPCAATYLVPLHWSLLHEAAIARAAKRNDLYGIHIERQ